MAAHLETAGGRVSAAEDLGPFWGVGLESDSGSGSNPVESPHEHIVVIVAATVSASVAVLGIAGFVLWHRQQARLTVRRQSGLPNYDFMVKATGERRMGRCRSAVLILFGLFIVTSEFTATALLLWFGARCSSAGARSLSCAHVRSRVGRSSLESFSAWLPTQQSLGVLIFLGICVFSLLCCAPSTPLWLIGGFCFKVCIL